MHSNKHDRGVSQASAVDGHGHASQAVLYKTRDGDSLYQDSGGVKAAWYDLFKASVGYVQTGMDLHKVSEGPDATSQGLCQATEGGLHDHASQGKTYQAGHDGGEYLAARAALYLASIGQPGDATLRGPNPAGIGEHEIAFYQVAAKVAHCQASDSEFDAAAGLYHAGSQVMPSSGGHDISSQDLYQDRSSTEADVGKQGSLLEALVECGDQVQLQVSGQVFLNAGEGHDQGGELDARDDDGVTGLALPGHVLTPKSAVPGHALPPRFAVPGHVLPPGLAVLEHALPPGAGLALSSLALPPGPAVHVYHAVPGLDVPVHAAPGPAVSTGQNPSMIEDARNDKMQEDKKRSTLPVYDCEGKVKVSDSIQGINIMIPSFKKVARIMKEVRSPRKSERKEFVKAALVLLMWRKFLARQKQLLDYMALSDHRFIGCSVTSRVDEFSHSRCLNDTSRAISAKLEVAIMLASIGQLLTQPGLCFQPEESDIVEQSDAEKIISLAGSVPTF